MIHTHSYSLSGGAIRRYPVLSGTIRCNPAHPVVLLGAIRRYPAALSSRYPSSLSDSIQCYPALSKHYPALSGAIRCYTAALSGAIRRYPALSSTNWRFPTLSGSAIRHHYPALSFIFIHTHSHSYSLSGGAIWCYPSSGAIIHTHSY
jgi:hypothetical protein